MTRFISCCLVVAGLCLLGTGCQKITTPNGMPELLPFEVTITQEGKPLTGAYVVLKSEAVGYLVDGMTNDHGVAPLKTDGQYKGAPAGDYKALIKKEIPTPSKFGDIPPVGDDKVAQWSKDRAKEYRPTHSLVAKKYGKAETSGLTVSVKADGSATLEVGKAVDDIIIPPGSSAKAK